MRVRRSAYGSIRAMPNRPPMNGWANRCANISRDERSFSDELYAGAELGRRTPCFPLIDLARVHL